MTMTTTTETGRESFEAALPRYKELIADLRATADELAAEGSPEARMRARVLRCMATKDENWMFFFLEALEIGLKPAAAKWCPNGPIRRPTGWTPEVTA